MRDFKELQRLIKEKFNIGKTTVKEGHWDSDSETFSESGTPNCYHVQVEKSFLSGTLIKTLGQFSEIDQRKSEFKKQLVEILKQFKNKGCEIHLSQSSTSASVKFDIWIIRTDDLDKWYVPINRSEWFDKDGSMGWRSPRFLLGPRQLARLKSTNWVVLTGEEVNRERNGGNRKWYDRVWIDRVNIGFYYVYLDRSEMVPDRHGFVKSPRIAFVRMSDDYFLCFFGLSHISNSSSYPDCLIDGKEIFKCDQLEGLIKCIQDYQF